MKIRAEQPGDIEKIRDLNLNVFDTSSEAELVDKLREDARLTISIVAEDGHSIVGHIMFTPVAIKKSEELKLMSISSLAVYLAYQKRGIGSLLVKSGVMQCRNLDIGAVVAVGDVQFFSRFGFLPASQYDLSCELEHAGEVLMIKELMPGYLNGVTGTVIYHPAFKKA